MVVCLGHVTYTICYEQDRYRKLELAFSQTKIFFHAVQPGIANCNYQRC